MRFNLQSMPGKLLLTSNAIIVVATAALVSFCIVMIGVMAYLANEYNSVEAIIFIVAAVLLALTTLLGSGLFWTYIEQSDEVSYGDKLLLIIWSFLTGFAINIFVEYITGKHLSNTLPLMVQIGIMLFYATGVGCIYSLIVKWILSRFIQFI